METPKLEGSWLETFPPDIWANFAWYLAGEQLGRLMMTGATFVRQRLKSPNVVKSAKLGRDLLVTKSCPRFLTDFPSLEELSIHRYDRWDSELRVTLDMIPSGVRTLELSGEWKHCADVLFGVNGSTLKLNQCLPHLEVLELPRLNFGLEYSWLMNCPPSLTKLSIRHWKGLVELPLSLIQFEAVIVDLSRDSKLPPALDSFVVEDLRGVDKVVPFLPPSTRTLALTSFSGGQWSVQNLIERLPRLLTRLVVPTSVGRNFESNPALVSLFPTTLTSLDLLDCLSFSGWSLFPPKLTQLSFWVSIPLNQETLIPFDKLPRSITTLEIRASIPHYCGPPSTPYHSFFPPQLTCLKYSSLRLSPEMAKQLPSSLTYLEIGFLSEYVCQNLPAGLKTLVSNATLLTPNLIDFLPRSLTVLRLSIPLPNDLRIYNVTGLDPVTLPDLPDRSIHAMCMTNSFNWKDYSPLPPSIMHFKLSLAFELGDSFLLHQQLPNLLELRLTESKHFTDASIPLLSPHLTSLDLGFSSEVSGKSFEFLPRCLTYLKLSTSELIFDADIQHLPRTLKEAYMSHAIYLTDLCIPDLPPPLEKLSLRYNSQVTHSIFPKYLVLSTPLNALDM